MVFYIFRVVGFLEACLHKITTYLLSFFDEVHGSNEEAKLQMDKAF